jgi:hypothetical protein
MLAGRCPSLDERRGGAQVKPLFPLVRRTDASASKTASILAGSQDRRSRSAAQARAQV